MNYKYINYLVSILFKYIKGIIIFNNNIKIILKTAKYLFNVFEILYTHNKFYFRTLNEIVCIDFLKKRAKRFEVNYLLLSYINNLRLTVSILVDESDSVWTSKYFYSSGDWLEREVYDMYGIYFLGHNDLRRILTDYGFEGYPFRKDYPLNGFIELRYDEYKQFVVYESIELMQNMRFFDFLNPYIKS